MQGVQRAMRVALNREEEKLETSPGVSGHRGLHQPYIGLFGTVWGIMNSFRSLANMSQATLAIGCARYFRGAGCYRHGSVRRHSRGDRLQPLFGPGRSAHEALRRRSVRSSAAILYRAAHAKR